MSRTFVLSMERLFFAIIQLANVVVAAEYDHLESEMSSDMFLAFAAAAAAVVSAATDAAKVGFETGFLIHCVSAHEGFAEAAFAEKIAAAVMCQVCSIVEGIGKVAESSKIVASKNLHFLYPAMLLLPLFGTDCADFRVVSGPVSAASSDPHQEAENPQAEGLALQHPLSAT